MNAMIEMRRVIYANRILLKPSFQDFDRTKSCHVTNQQFQRVLKNLTLAPTNEKVLDLIIRKYLDKSNSRDVNYFTFCLRRASITASSSCFKPSSGRMS